MAKDRNSEEIKKLLNSNGFMAEIIPACLDYKSPDLAVVDKSGQKYLVEVKNIQSDRLTVDRDWIDEDFQVKKGINSIDNTLSGVIEKAFEQLSLDNLCQDTIRGVWFILDNPSDYISKNIKRTLYGTRFVNDIRLGECKICFYADRSDFYRFKEALDFVVVSSTSFCSEVLLNSLSIRFERIKSSQFINLFKNAVFDPLTELKDNAEDYLHIDPTLDNTNEVLALAAIKSKYNLFNPQFYNINHYEI